MIQSTVSATRITRHTFLFVICHYIKVSLKQKNITMHQTEETQYKLYVAGGYPYLYTNMMVALQSRNNTNAIKFGSYKSVVCCHMFKKYTPFIILISLGGGGEEK